MPAILENINWIDIFFVILLAGMVYKGSRVGVGGQVVPVLGYFALIFVSIEYYSLLSERLFGFLSMGWAKPASFFVISAGVFLAVKVLERICAAVSDREIAAIEKIGGMLMASFRAFILFGIIGIMLLLLPVDPIRHAVAEGSRTGMFFVDLDARIYSWMTGLIGISKEKRKDEVVKEFLTPKKD